MAKLIACEFLAGWRRKLWEIERLQLSNALMNYDSILKLVDGSPALRAGSYLPISQAATAMGLDVADLLREAADGHLALYYRFIAKQGYTARFSDFDPDDPELGTVVVPTRSNRPEGSRIVRASGVYRVPRGETGAIAARLLTGKHADVISLEVIGGEAQSVEFVPDDVLRLEVDQVELSCSELELRRQHMASLVSQASLAAARQAQRATTNELLDSTPQRAKAPLSKVLDDFCRSHLPQVLASEKDIERMRNGIALLIEFEGDLSIGTVNAERLRHFRDVHLARMPANENRVRSQYGTKSMTESIGAVSGSEWPRMSADERDMRMKWIARMFRWAHAEKWIADDPCTGLRKESVLTKAERTRVQSERPTREEFTEQELHRIFSANWFLTGTGEKTKAGTYRTFQPFHYWLPLLGLCTGARINELAQLYLDDIRQDGAVWYIDINRKTPDKSLKNDWSERKVPLHSCLIELGFAEWCDELRAAGFPRFFPELSWNSTNRYAKDPIRVMSQYLERLGMPRNGTKVFHSFRHGINNALQKRTSMPDWMRKRFMGHEPGSGVNERHYLSDATPVEMSLHLEAIKMPLSHVMKFHSAQGVEAVRDALRRKNGGRGTGEILGHA
ncbi:integrase [Hydrogenophaga laconesensis]|uniref:Integrase n=2 Tax=Hydrogenophaga laconesensis TaxID=1805971 RepID=A0ABU1VIM0_9BURK|nr:integrase [Hydrogenophaga laconesensis]